jgi:hypothetical protein
MRSLNCGDPQERGEKTACSWKQADGNNNARLDNNKDRRVPERAALETGVSGRIG